MKDLTETLYDDLMQFVAEKTLTEAMKRIKNALLNLH